MEKTKDFLLRLYHNGVIAFVCGKKPLRIRLIPPIVSINEDDIINVVKIIEQTLLEG